MTREEERSQAARIRADQYSHPSEWNDCYRHFSQGAEWADRTLIEKACEWMREEFYTSKDRDGHNILISASWDNVEELVEDFKKQMEA